MKNKIEKHLTKLNFDIRQTCNARYFDQKGKIDVVSFLAECVLELIKDDEDKEFGMNDIWKMNYFEEKVPEFFNKPKPSDPAANNEYDKFVSQPILVFYYSGLLQGRKNGTWKFRCRNKELLDYVSRNPRNTHEFLARYYEKVFIDSGLEKPLNNFMTKQNQQSLDSLRDKFYHLMYKFTPIGNRCASGDEPGKLEAIRIFNPVLNIICSSYHLKGTELGHVSDHIIRYDELQYNRINFRDKYKQKEITRKRAKPEMQIEISREKFYAHQEEKAKKAIKEKYGKRAMFLDDYHKCTNPEIHHIILKSDKIQFRGYPENLINLSPTQHRNLAHAHGTGVSTKQADPTYQRKLLVANSFYIERSIKRQEPIYSKIQLIELLIEGIELDISETATFDEIRKKISDGFFDDKEIKKIRTILLDIS